MATVAEVGVQLNTRDAVNNLRRLDGATRKTTKGFDAMGAALKALPLIGLADATRRFFKGFAEADKARAAVRSLGVDANILQQELFKVSNSLGGLIGQTELTAAAYDVASAGFVKASDAAQVLEASAKGAIGGMSDLNTVADATTSVLNAYGLSSDKAGKLVDGFIQTQNDGKIVVAQYAAQIGRVAPIAAAAGVGIEELNAAISSVTAQGVPVESTFSGLRQAIASVIKPTEEAKKTAAALGIEFTSAAIKAKGFGGFLQDVVDKTGGSEVALTKLFGSVEAIATILPLANDGLVSYNKNLKNQADATGAADKATELLGGTVSAQTTSIVNNIGNVVRQLDTVLGPALKRILSTVNNIIVALNTALSKFNDLTTGELDRASAQFQGISTILQVLGSGRSAPGLQNVRDAVRALNPMVATSVQELDKMQGALNRAGFAADRVSQRFGGDAAPEINKLAEQTRGAIFAMEQLIRKRREALAAGPGTKGEEPKLDPQLKAAQQRIEALLAQLDASGSGSTSSRLSEADRKRLQLAREVQQIEEAALRTQEEKAKAYEDQFRSIDDQRIILEATLRGNVEEVKNAMLLRDLIRENGVERGNILYNAELFNQELERQVDLHDEAQKALEAQAQKMDDLYQGIGQSIQTGIVDALTAAVEGTKSLADVASQVLRQVANILLQFGVNTALGGIPGLSAFFPGRAAGGPVTGGKPYMVGEKGPELFVPNSSGNIVPNNKLGGGANVVVNVDAKGTSASGDSAAGKQLGGLIGAAVQSEIVKQQRPGGLLAR